MAAAPADWDNYSFLCHESFKATAPLANVLIGSDDFSTLGRSGFRTVFLTTGTRYLFVQTGISNYDTGAFELTISGPGDLAWAIPEPAPTATVTLALAAMGALLFRRRSPTA
jgi:hypothetical protein